MMNNNFSKLLNNINNYLFEEENDKQCKLFIKTQNNNNNENIDFSLQQGKKYQSKRKEMKSYLEKKYNIVEGFNGNINGNQNRNNNNISNLNATSDYKPPENELWNKNQQSRFTIDENVKKELSQLKKLEDEYKNALSKYSRTYRQYMEDVMKFVNKDNAPYNGKNIRLPNGAIYYITNSGKARWYSPKAWDNKHNTCNTEPLSVSKNNIEDLGFQVALPMKENQPCGYEMQNIQVGEIKSEVKNVASANNGATARQKDNWDIRRFPPSNSIDGNNRTFNHTRKSKGAWLEVTFENNSEVRSIVIRNRDDLKYRNRLSNFNVLLFDKNNKQVFKKNIRRTQNEQLLFSINNLQLEAKKIKIEQNDNEFLHVAEVQVIGREIVSNQNNGELGYVNDEGILRYYPNNRLNNKTGTCPTNIRKVDNDTWKSFEIGNDMLPSTLCALGNVSPNLKEEVIRQNEELIRLSEQIYSKINQTRRKIKELDLQDEVEEDYLQNQLQRFKVLFNEMKRINNKSDTLDAMVEDSMSKHKIFNYNYIMWSALTVLLVFFAYKRMKN